MPDTLFGRISRHETDTPLLYEDDQVVAFRDIYPKAPVHLLIVPKKPLPSLAAASDGDRDLLGHLLLVARRLADEHGLTGSGYKIVLNTGADAGQMVPHLHLHLLGGTRLDGVT